MLVTGGGEGELKSTEAWGAGCEGDLSEAAPRETCGSTRILSTILGWETGTRIQRGPEKECGKASQVKSHPLLPQFPLLRN